MPHDLIFAGEDHEAIALRCVKCQANARFLKTDEGVATTADNGYTVSQDLQDKWLGAECPAD